jgi:hypothetical protein
MSARLNVYIKMLRQPINIYGNVKVVARFGWLELLVLVLVSKN